MAMAEFQSAGRLFEVAVAVDPATAINDLLVTKGLNPRDRLLAVGEYERLVAILGERYPEAVEAWVGLQVRGLQGLRAGGASDEFIRRADLHTYYEELRVLFERFPERFIQVMDIIEFY
ncbi:MAG: hypothetical protein HYS86_03520 [Candidatus Chisholmbacteria bacterium]|nr:hypothetical protein [Candidatus Chisholmbacteria bacterium]